jgi:hypothetical protein
MILQNDAEQKAPLSFERRGRLRRLRLLFRVLSSSQHSTEKIFRVMPDIEKDPQKNGSGFLIVTDGLRNQPAL